MLEGLLGRGFSSKCKSLIKLTKTRIDVIRRKRNATQKYLKKDMADLLANGLDINAYGRADGLLAELILSSCYDFVEHSCDCVLKHLSMMQKQSECPEECKVAVASLMFAAARFSDLPELRDIRDMFQERYGNSLEYSVNQKFVENLSSNSSTLEKKVRLMQEIAAEFSIKWNYKDFEQRMTKTSVSAPDKSKTYGSFHVTDDKSKSSNGNNTVPEKEKKNLLSKEKPTNVHRSSGWEDTLLRKDNGDDQLLRKQDLSSNGYKPVNNREEIVMKRVVHDLPFRQEKEVIFDKHESYHRREEATPNVVRLGSSSHDRRQEFTDAGYKQQNSKDNAEPKRDAVSHGRHDLRPNNERVVHDLFRQEKEVIFDKHESHHRRDEATPNTSRLGSSSHDRRQEFTDAGYKRQTSKDNAEPKRDAVSRTRHELRTNNEELWAKTYEKDIPVADSNNHDELQTIAISVGKAKEEENNGAKSFNHLIPPPYTKPPKASTPGSSSRTKKHSSYNWNGPTEYSMDASDRTGANSHEKSVEVNIKSDNHEYEEQMAVTERVRSHDQEKVHHRHHRNNIKGEPMPKPRSVRRRHSKASSNYDDTNDMDDRKVKRSSSSRRRGESRRGLQQILFDDDPLRKDEEENIIDKLLIHYSTKPTNFHPEKLIRKPRGQPSQHELMVAGELTQNRSRDGGQPAETPDMVPPPPRSISLPHEQISSSEPTKVFTRAASFQPDRPAQHVHPKLPDYDDLAARFAAMRGR